MRKLRSLPQPARCSACGVVFQPRYRTRRPVCSEPCYYLLRRGPARPPRFRFVTRGGPACRLCHAPRRRVFSMGWCLGCREPFVVVAGKGDRYCGPECGKRVLAQLRDARRRAQSGSRVYRAKVFERDGWTCRLCGKPVDREARVPEPLAATLDHVVPLSLGGAHSYANIQTAHFSCNSVKGANVTQLAFAA